MKNKSSIYFIFWVLSLLSLPAWSFGQATTMGTGFVAFGLPGGDENGHPNVTGMCAGSGLCNLSSQTFDHSVQCSFVTFNYDGYFVLIMGFNIQDAVANANFISPQNGGTYPLNSFTFPASNTTGVPASSRIVSNGIFFLNPVNNYGTITALLSPPQQNLNIKVPRPKTHYKAHKSQHKSHKTYHSIHGN